MEAQNLILDETVGLEFVYSSDLTFVVQGDRFSSFGSQLAQTSRRAGQAFGIGTGSLRTWRLVSFIVTIFLLLWISGKVFNRWGSRS